MTKFANHLTRWTLHMRCGWEPRALMLWGDDQCVVLSAAADLQRLAGEGRPLGAVGGVLRPPQQTRSLVEGAVVRLRAQCVATAVEMCAIGSHESEEVQPATAFDGHVQRFGDSRSEHGAHLEECGGAALQLACQVISRAGCTSTHNMCVSSCAGAAVGVSSITHWLHNGDMYVSSWCVGHIRQSASSSSLAPSI